MDSRDSQVGRGIYSVWWIDRLGWYTPVHAGRTDALLFFYLSFIFAGAQKGAKKADQWD
jgi:hypothetical protein